MKSPPAGLRGAQRPRIEIIPPHISSAGQEAIELAATAGLILDPWQCLILNGGLTENTDGTWASFEVGVLVARQNGKGSILEARELAGLYLFGEQLITHSAHEFKTSKEAFRRILMLIENTPELDRRIKRVSRSHGEEGIELKSGQRLLFATRTGGGGRGFSGDCVILDEAYNLGEGPIDALLPTMSARPNPQVWYTSSAPDRNLAPCEALSRLRGRALSGGSEDLAYFEWSIDPHTEFCPSSCSIHDDPEDIASWAKANPGLGYRITAEFIAKEREALSAGGFARERLSVGRYVEETSGWAVISQDAWGAVADPGSNPRNPVAFAIDVKPEFDWGCIAVAGRRADGLKHVEVVDHLPGTTWIVDRVAELVKRWRPCAVVIDSKGAASSLIPELEARRIRLKRTSTAEVVQACGIFHSAVVRPQEAPPDWKPTLRHLDQPRLNAAVAAATPRKIGGDAWAWGRSSVSADISPLVACTLALWGHTKWGRTSTKPRMAVA